MACKWTNGEVFTVTPELASAKWGSPFGCLMCDHLFKAGDKAKWVYTNHGKYKWSGGNFFVCDKCGASYNYDNEAIANQMQEVYETMKSHALMWERFAG